MTRVHVFVEGRTERTALPKLFHALGISSGVQPPLVLPGSKFFSQIGRRAAALLAGTHDDHVFACPDLAPRQHVPWPYTDCAGLHRALQDEVRRELAARLAPRVARAAMKRFHPHPFRHDFEVLLLAMPDALRSYLRAGTDITRHFNSRRPEDQDFDRYPKRVIEFLFRKLAGRRYNDVDDYRAIIEHAKPEDLRTAAASCPCFTRFVAELRETVASQ